MLTLRGNQNIPFVLSTTGTRRKRSIDRRASAEAVAAVGSTIRQSLLPIENMSTSHKRAANNDKEANERRQRPRIEEQANHGAAISASHSLEYAQQIGLVANAGRQMSSPRLGL